MASLWFLKLALNCIDHFAWPLLALGYPMCASVQAIETDSNKEMRDLISYWILLSLLYLFEYAFMKLLQWFEFWPYMKLMIIFWLIIPDFGRASYVYSNLIRAYIFTKPQTAICRLNKWRKFFVKKENFSLLAEKYVKKNGTEAFEKLITSKTNGKMLQTEHKDIKDLEVIEKKEIPAGKQDIPSTPNLAPSQNASSTMVESKGIAVKVKAGEEFPQSSIHKEVQKEWTCALCQVSASSKKNLNSHLHGKKHRAAHEALKAKTQPVPQKLKIDLPKEERILKNIITKPVPQKLKIDLPKEERKQKNIITKPVPQKLKIDLPKEEQKQKNIITKPVPQKLKIDLPKEEQKQKNIITKPVPQKLKIDLPKEEQKQKNIITKPVAQKLKIDLPKEERKQKNIITNQLSNKTNKGESIVNISLKGNAVMDHNKGQEMQKILSEYVRVKYSNLRCEFCNVRCTSEGDMASHLNGRKHLANIMGVDEFRGS
ncbi:uncharacterized protein LOC130710791 isoform X2 [Lotus japonicus]|uniref:uncharacterized protein LOC130710791 isoform X2 n=1 Tax=Lotus japonicus TaxID=34305 RepID=UPI00258F259A|nr:uncharacterized protein LOC130710791 isoform X2 [Lotus japonicus]